MAKPTAPAAVTIEDVRAAAAAIEGAVVKTPLNHARTLSAITGTEVFLKFEIFQFTASFKERGALNRLLTLDPAERQAGVIAMSAGNHAQAVAYHAQRLGIHATIVMPETTPFIKVRHTRDFGATVELHGKTLTEARAHANGLAAERGLIFVHPYDDPAVIAGQGTIALEMLAARPALDVLVVPIGGGGLIGGMALAAKAIKPEIAVIGAQVDSYPAMHELFHGRPPTGGGSTIAEGIAVTEPGTVTRELVHNHVDDVILVTEDQIEEALTLLTMVEKVVVEGAGAVGLAALLAAPERFAGRRVGLVLCGASIDQRLLSTVLMRDLVRQGRMARLRVPLPDTPGELARVTTIIGKHGGNIVDVIHQRAFAHLPAKLATADFAIETRDKSQMDEILAQIRNAGLDARKVDD